MIRFTTMLALAALVPSALSAQNAPPPSQGGDKDAVVAYTTDITHGMNPAHRVNFAHGMNSVYGLSAAHAMNTACTSCHTSNPIAVDLMVNGKEPASFLQLAYSTAYSEAAAHSSAHRIGSVTFVPLGSDLIRSHLPIGDQAAVIVSAVDSEGELVKPGDVLLTVNTISVNEPAKIQGSVEEDREKPAALVFIRGGKKMQIKVPGSLLARPEQPYLIGVQVEQPGDALRSQLRLYENEGLLITEVVDDSPAQKSGFE
ncbi:MAG: hypothetical protein AAFU85_31945, partial [Planctomycetota bacterium]